MCGTHYSWMLRCKKHDCYQDVAFGHQLHMTRIPCNEGKYVDTWLYILTCDWPQICIYWGLVWWSQGLAVGSAHWLYPSPPHPLSHPVNSTRKYLLRLGLMESGTGSRVSSLALPISSTPSLSPCQQHKKVFTEAVGSPHWLYPSPPHPLSHPVNNTRKYLLRQ